MTRVVLSSALYVTSLLASLLAIDSPQDTRGGELSLQNASPAIIAAYQGEFGLALERPAYYIAADNGGCATAGNLTTTAYLKRGLNEATLFVMYLSPDATSVRKRERLVVLRPAGKIKVLAVLIRYKDIFDAQTLEHWVAAQRQVNDDHAAFARERGFDRPIVEFQNTNVIVDGGSPGLTPRNPASVRAAAERQGEATGDYHLIMAIDINPTEQVGGYAVREERAVYVGNYSGWKTLLGSREWARVAMTAYHHEVAHHWGWAHDWVLTCGRAKRFYDPFVAPPLLFGWDDVDGDGVPEVLDDTPYGTRLSLVPPKSDRSGRSGE